ncbi:MAG TPA: NAD-dependent deacylase [Solirubrobacterales bacterium]|nr:NAD-dependent deacylase [Solirubrobacterales bacterium]
MTPGRDTAGAPPAGADALRSGATAGGTGAPGAATSAGVLLLAELLRESRATVVLTGAGISVPSGIPDFRTPGTGLWANVDPMEVAHIDAWRGNPDRFWRFYGDRFASLVDKRPNRAHHAIVELERLGLVDGVITQNVDRLHRMAGSERLVEVHGSIEWSVCMRCGGRRHIDEVVDLLAATEGAPECAACVEPLKPAVVLFGELLPAEALEQAQRLAREADLILCVGSSLEVHPVSALPGLTRSGGGKIALVTQGPTPYDSQAAVRLGGDVVAELEAVLSAVR